MVTQYERAFSVVRKTLTPKRNAFGLTILESRKRLLWWWTPGVVSGKVAVASIASRVQIEAQIAATLLGGLGDDVE
jgi:hypothetical protein